MDSGIVEGVLYPTVMIVVGGAIIGGWVVFRRGMVETVREVVKTMPHEPCADLLAHKAEAKNNWLEIFSRLANLDATTKEIQQAQLRSAERQMDMSDKISYLSSLMGYAQYKNGEDKRHDHPTI